MNLIVSTKAPSADISAPCVVESKNVLSTPFLFIEPISIIFLLPTTAANEKPLAIAFPKVLKSGSRP